MDPSQIFTVLEMIQNVDDDTNLWHCYHKIVSYAIKYQKSLAQVLEDVL